MPGDVGHCRAWRRWLRGTAGFVAFLLLSSCIAGEGPEEGRQAASVPPADTQSPADATVPPPMTAARTPQAAPPTVEPATPTPKPAVTSWPDAPLPEDFRLGLEVVAQGLDQPVFVTAPHGDPRLFVVEKRGRIRIIRDGSLASAPFLDIGEHVVSGEVPEEQGLFALAFHPDYAGNGRFFVHYTSQPHGHTRVEEYRVSESDADQADIDTGRTILEVDQPFHWHNGGMMMFGPDEMLWLALGDGGLRFDPEGHGQNPATLLGAILRIDVDAPGGVPYAPPPDNPFADGQDGAPEVWSYGLRNPWRFDIDPREGLIYIADAGQHRFEEINVVPVDAPPWNFGWSLREGTHCFPDLAADCGSDGLTDPVFEYVHDGVACAVIGGFVYRGKAMPELSGRYFYTDFCDGRIRSFRYRQGEVAEERDWSEQFGHIALPTSFGLDADGELYVTSGEGAVYRIVPGSR